MTHDIVTHLRLSMRTTIDIPCAGPQHGRSYALRVNSRSLVRITLSSGSKVVPKTDVAHAASTDLGPVDPPAS
jgi:hypothetical protein